MNTANGVQVVITCKKNWEFFEDSRIEKIIKITQGNKRKTRKHHHFIVFISHLSQNSYFRNLDYYMDFMEFILFM